MGQGEPSIQPAFRAQVISCSSVGIAPSAPASRSVASPSWAARPSSREAMAKQIHVGWFDNTSLTVEPLLATPRCE